MIAHLLLVALAAAPSKNPLAELWPYQAKRLPNGEVEYTYDLVGLKKLGSTPDAVAAHGEEKVKEFLASLPREARVRLKQGSTFSLGSGRGAEPVPLVTSLSAISAAKVVSNNPIARAPGALIRTPLHPEEPKMLLSAEAALWRARRLFEGAEAAIAIDSDRVHAALWNTVADRAVARIKTVNGDAKEGAACLAGRLYAAGACFDPTKLPASARAINEVAAAFDAELVAAKAEPDTAVPPGFFSWTRELGCTHVRIKMLSRPFPPSRAGVAAGLTLLGLFAADPKLEASWVRLRARRDALTIGPAKEPLLDYRERTGGKIEDTLENMAGFVDALGDNLPAMPPPFETSTSPFSRFFSELEAPGRISAVDELLAAAQDSRLAFPSQELSPVFPRFESALACLVSDDPKGTQLDAAWRDRRAAAFAALIGGHRDSADDGRDIAETQDERSDLRVRLLVPPSLEIEPATRAYLEAATALDQLAEALPKLGLAGIQAVQPEGGRSAVAIPTEARRLASVLRGLSKISADLPAADADKDLVEARKFLAAWRTDPIFAKDVREARALEVNQGAQRLHAAIIGVARRELLVGFQSKISTTLAAPGPFDVTAADQRYLVPVLITRAALGKSSSAALDRGALKTMCESAKRQPNEIEAAFVDAMKTR